MEMRARRATTGLAVSAVYLAVVAVSFRSGLVPVRPLYEGTSPPPPYRWVAPPPDLAATNKKPDSGTATFGFDKRGSIAFNAYTGDAQAAVIFPPGAIKRHGSDSKFRADVKPLDPAGLGAPPKGTEYDGNAYEFAAVYLPSGDPVELTAPNPCPKGFDVNTCVTVVIRYPYDGLALVRRDGDAWTTMNAQLVDATMQVYGDSPTLGTFVTVAAKRAPGAARPSRKRGGDFLPFALGLSAILAGTYAARARAVRKRIKRSAASARARRAPNGQSRPRR